MTLREVFQLERQGQSAMKKAKNKKIGLWDFTTWKDLEMGWNWKAQKGHVGARVNLGGRHLASEAACLADFKERRF